MDSTATIALVSKAVRTYEAKLAYQRVYMRSYMREYMAERSRKIREERNAALLAQGLPIPKRGRPKKAVQNPEASICPGLNQGCVKNDLKN